MQIDDLLTSYFEGETSSEEESRIRAYFASGDVREDLRKYKPLFAYFDEEILKEQQPSMNQEKISPKKSVRRLLLYSLTGVAASMLLVLGIGHYINRETRFCSENYVVINGHCYTDIHKVHSLALEALQEVSDADEFFLPDLSDDTGDKEIIEDQLKEFGFLLDED